MITIHKFTLEITDEQTIAVHCPKEFLVVQLQDNKLCMWVMVDDSKPKEDFVFRVIGTGHPIPDYKKLTHFATVQHGPLVWHVFFKDKFGNWD